MSLVGLAAKFWDRWYSANELDRVKIVEELGIEKSAVSSHAVATLVNSFFVDLVEYVEVRRKEVS